MKIHLFKFLISICVLLGLSSTFSVHAAEVVSCPKIYVHSDQIKLAENEILIQLRDQVVATTAIHLDGEGFYFQTMKQGDCPGAHWKCPKCGDCNWDAYLRCPNCGHVNW